MSFPDRLVVLRGGGDLGTGVAWRLTRAGFPLVVCELSQPLTIRRRVALSSAVDDGRVDVEDMAGVLVGSAGEAMELAGGGVIPVVVSERLPEIERWMVVDARMAKRNLDTTLGDAELVVGLGPGFEAGSDCHAVVETMRGHRLGRVLWKGSAAADTGTPGELGGRAAERVVRAPTAGVVSWERQIGDLVAPGGRLGRVGAEVVATPIGGVIRGLIAPGRQVWRGLKIADVDPRADTPVGEISDKALAIGGGVVEAALTWLNR
jgi:xanthine dehydrogenase accessory factor